MKEPLRTISQTATIFLMSHPTPAFLCFWPSRNSVVCLHIFITITPARAFCHMPFLYPLYHLSTKQEACVKSTCFIGVNQVRENEQHVHKTSVSIMLNGGRRKKKKTKWKVYRLKWNQLYNKSLHPDSGKIYLTVAINVFQESMKPQYVYGLSSCMENGKLCLSEWLFLFPFV